MPLGAGAGAAAGVGAGVGAPTKKYGVREPYTAPNRFPVRKAKPSAFPTVAPQRPAAQARAEGAVGNSYGLGQSMVGVSGNLLSNYGRTFAPLERRLAATAEIPIQSYVDPAAVDASTQFDQSLGVMNRDLSRMGISPDSGRFAGLQQQWGRARAAAKAGAMTRAARQGRLENFNRLLQAVGVGGNRLGLATNLLSGAAGIGFQAADRYGDIAYGQGFQSEIDKLFQSEGIEQ